jgi:hypothetical protein
MHRHHFCDAIAFADRPIRGLVEVVLHLRRHSHTRGFCRQRGFFPCSAAPRPPLLMLCWTTRQLELYLSVISHSQKKSYMTRGGLRLTDKAHPTSRLSGGTMACLVQPSVPFRRPGFIHCLKSQFSQRQPEPLGARNSIVSQSFVPSSNLKFMPLYSRFTNSGFQGSGWTEDPPRSKLESLSFWNSTISFAS